MRVSLARRVLFNSYQDSRQLAASLMIDGVTKAITDDGRVEHGVRRIVGSFDRA